MTTKPAIAGIEHKGFAGTPPPAEHWALGRFIVGSIVVGHVALIAWGAWCHSPTIDEPAYLAAGISHWRFGRFDLCKVSPPLVRLWAALPVVLSDPRTDWRHYEAGPGRRAEHLVGSDFIAANGRRSFWWFTLARWACIPFSLLGAWTCWRWALALYGPSAGRLALVLWCFGPNILAHAQLMTPDVGVTALSITCCYALWVWTYGPSWRRALSAGLLLGLAVLAKTNALILFALVPLACGLARHRENRSRSTDLLQCATMIVVAIHVINTGYGFSGTGTRLGVIPFVSRTFAGRELPLSTGNRFMETSLESVPVPLPVPFIEGIDLQRRDFENASGALATYFRGRWYDHGWWWYYPYVVAVKVPLGFWFLLVLALVGLTRGFSPAGGRAQLLMVFVPGLLLFAIACAQTGFGGGLRYVLPSFPFWIILASGAAALPAALWCRLTRTIAVIWVTASSLSVYPHSLSYFNELAGGPENGHAHLLGGNIDWGEDLLQLERWIAHHPEARPIQVAFWSSMPLRSVESGWQRPPAGARSPNAATASVPPELAPGWYAVSVSFLRQDRGDYSYFAHFSPVDRVGYSVLIYRLTDEELSRLRSR